MDDAFSDLQLTEECWPGTDTPDPKSLYPNVYDELHHACVNIVCSSCGTIDHNPLSVHLVPIDSPLLSLLSVDPAVTKANFACGVHSLDNIHVMIDKLGLITDSNGGCQLQICSSCYCHLNRGNTPPHSLANFRWTGPVPPELIGLTWIEERLISRAHMVGMVLRLQPRGVAYGGLKGHLVLLPQDTTALVNILPIPPSSLPDTIRVVWTGKSAPDNGDLAMMFKVRTQRVYDALRWLVRNHHDYESVTLNYREFARWPPVFVADDLIHSMAQGSDVSNDDLSGTGFATEDIDVLHSHGSLPITSSAIVDVNQVSQSAVSVSLRTLASLSADATCNVVFGNSLKSDFTDPAFFTSAFPLLFPYGIGKHIDSKRKIELKLSTWVSLLLKDSSRYIALIFNSR